MSTENVDQPRKMFVKCEVCGKKLIERRSNGLWHFVFGRKKRGDGKLAGRCPVDILIHGSIRMRCLSNTCGHINTLNYFPNTTQQGWGNFIQDAQSAQEEVEDLGHLKVGRR